MQAGAQFADFVEEESASIGLRQRTLARGDGAGEGAALVSEQLASGELRHERRTVHRDQITAALAAVEVMDHPGKQLLAGPAFAHEQNGSLGEPGGFGDTPDERPPHGAVPDQRAGDRWIGHQIVDGGPSLESCLDVLRGRRTAAPGNHVGCTGLEQAPGGDQIESRGLRRHSDHLTARLPPGFAQEGDQGAGDLGETDDAVAL